MVIGREINGFPKEIEGLRKNGMRTNLIRSGSDLKEMIRLSLWIDLRDHYFLDLSQRPLENT